MPSPGLEVGDPCCTYRVILGRRDIKIELMDTIQIQIYKTSGFTQLGFSPVHGHLEFLPGFSSLSLTPVLAWHPPQTQRVYLLLRMLRRGMLYTVKSSELGIGKSQFKFCLQLSWGKSFNFSQSQGFHL